MIILNADIVQGFVNTILSSKFDGATESPAFHRECWELCTSKAPLVAIAAPRSHAKTTGVTVSYGLSTLLFRQRKFMLLVSDTEAQATMFLGFFKEHLQDNETLADLFGLKRDENHKVKFIKDTETDIIVEFEDGHRFRIIAKGAEQKLRGLIWNGSRPDIILCDDMENDELVMNKDRREKMRRWFYSALMPCRSANGIVRVVGTILHMDSLLERLMPKHHNKFTHEEPLKTWHEGFINGGWKSVKYKAHNRDYSEILWESKARNEAANKEIPGGAAGYFKWLYEGYVAQGLPDAYSQEYLNIPLDESIALFKRHDLKDMEKEHFSLNKHYYITVDLAISEHERADYSVFMVAGVDENRRIFIEDVIRERIDARDIVDTLIALQTAWKPEFVGIEEMQVSKAIGPFLREEMMKTGVFLNLIPLKHGGKDKIQRSRAMQARVRTGTVYCNKGADWYPIFEDELTKFPRDVHDDQVDCFSYLGMLLDKVVEAPTVKELENEEYMDELRESTLSDAGRNEWCGY